MCDIPSSSDCREIVTPKRVDAEQIYRGRTSQPERTRNQKQADEALSIDRPTVRAGLTGQMIQVHARTAHPPGGTAPGLESHFPITGEAFCTRTQNRT